VADVERVQGAADRFPRDGGVVREKHGSSRRKLRIDRLDDRFIVDGAGRLGEELLHVEHHDEPAVGKLGHRGHEPRGLARQHARRHAHLRPVDAQYLVHGLDQHALRLAAVLGHDHDGFLRQGDAGIFREVHDGNENAAQAHHAFDCRGHVGRARDLRRAHHFAHFEDVDAVHFAPAGHGVGAEREHQDLELVRACEIGSRVDLFKQLGHGARFPVTPS
jgi:hypothetical protein